MSRLEFNDAEQALLKEAADLKERAKAAEQKAFNARDDRERERPLKDRLVFAASSYCDCGCGMAYDPVGESGTVITGYWECSAILIGVADENLKHTARLPFAFYEIKSENQPSAGGRTSREPIAPNPKVNPKVENS